MAGGAQDVEVMPTYVEFIKHTYTAVAEFAFDWKKYPVDYGVLYDRFTSFTVAELLWLIGVGIAFTIGRQILTVFIYLPLGKWLQLRQQDLRKFSESAWKLKVYSGLWIYSCHVIIFSGRHDYFLNPCRIWNITFPDIFYEPFPSDMQIMYFLQMGFYIHSLYATLCMDVWRKDSLMMILHHCITTLLLYFSFCMRYHKMGSLVLFLHDLSDVFLEFTKLNVYLRARGGRMHKFNDNLASLGFFTFTVSWAWCRLYWFPLKVLHSTTWGAYLYHLNRDPKLFVILNSMMFLLQALHVYWFYFIMVFLVKIATGQASEVEDTREYESDKGAAAIRNTENGSTASTNLRYRRQVNGNQNGRD